MKIINLSLLVSVATGLLSSCDQRPPVQQSAVETSERDKEDERNRTGGSNWWLYNSSSTPYRPAPSVNNGFFSSGSSARSTPIPMAPKATPAPSTVTRGGFGGTGRSVSAAS